MFVQYEELGMRGPFSEREETHLRLVQTPRSQSRAERGSTFLTIPASPELHRVKGVSLMNRPRFAFVLGPMRPAWGKTHQARISSLATKNASRPKGRREAQLQVCSRARSPTGERPPQWAQAKNRGTHSKPITYGRACGPQRGSCTRRRGQSRRCRWTRQRWHRWP